MITKIQTGEENFQEASAKAHTFFIPTSTYRGDGKESHVNAGKTHLKRVGGLSRSPATDDPEYREEFGMWTVANYRVEEGALLKLMCNRTRPNRHPRQQMGFILLRAREGAALIKVRARLTGDHRSRHPEGIYCIEGRYDVVALEDAEQDGARLKFREHGQAAYTDGLFLVEQISPALTSAPVVRERTVRNSKGEEVSVLETDGGRALDIG